MDTRLFPVTPEFFAKEIKPIIEGSYIWKGRPPEISHYHVYMCCARAVRGGICRPVTGRGIRFICGSNAVVSADCGGKS